MANSNQLGTPAAQCSTQLRRLHDAYFNLVSGKHSVKFVASDDREVQFTAPRIDELVKLYDYYFQMCGEGSGLPDIRTIHTSDLRERGGPAHIGIRPNPLDPRVNRVGRF